MNQNERLDFLIDAFKEEFWSQWSKHIYFNRYIDTPKPVYKDSF